MQELPVPISAADQAAFIQKMKDAAAPVLAVLPTTLDKQQRRSLNPRTIGPESMGFIEDGAILIKTHPTVLPRTISDVTIAEFGDRLQQFRDYSVIIAEVDKFLQPLRDARLLVGVHLRDTVREAHATARRDDGRTPGLAALVARLDDHLDRSPSDDAPDDAPDAPAKP